jgi:hypothetical protein
MLSVVA